MPLTVVRLWKTALSEFTAPLVQAIPRIVMSLKPTLLRMKVASLPDSELAEPTTTPAKSTWSGLTVINGAALIAVPVRLIGCCGA